MFKLVVLCALLAAVVAEPGALFASSLIAPLTYSSAVISPATTTITKSASSVVHPSPYLYSSPYYTHFIKKRSAPLLAAPYFGATTYVSPALATALIAPAPLVHSAPVYSAPLAYAAPAHFIKKRSAPLLTAPYFASPAYAAPLLPTTYSYAPALPAATLLPHAPLAYTHLIKKRSAPLIAASYIAPAAVSHQSRIDVQHSAPLITSYASPLAYVSPIGYSKIF